MNAAIRVSHFQVICVFAVLFSFLTLLAPSAYSQTDTATLEGNVLDPSGAVIPDAAVTVINDATQQQRNGRTDKNGGFSIQSLSPATYTVRVIKEGFEAVNVEDVVLHTADRQNVQIKLRIGKASQSVTVNAQTTNDSPAVSMTVSREFVENMPLNGQSFQDLIQLAPGTVSDQEGNYSINGQRTDSNIFTVDGVSADLTGINSTNGLAGNGPMQTALGTTQSLASIDSLEEFKIQTSGYTAEFGRSPGGQIQFTTRSGSNNTHGTLFDYFRNTVLDANSDQNDYNGDPKTAEHQNDFGGTLGGPLNVPKIYAGKDKTFYFFSYEGLRLLTPSNENEYVPTQAFRSAASPNAQPYLNVKPLPNPSSAGNKDGCTIIDPSTGNAAACDALFYYGYSNPSRLDNISLRVDQNLSNRLHAFVRYSDTPSSNLSGAETFITETANAHTWTAGLTANLTTALLDDFRFNYTRLGEERIYNEKSVGGSIPLQRSLLIPAAYESPFDQAFSIMDVPGSSLLVISEEYGEYSAQGQYQLIDSFSWTRKKHNLKFGADWRRIESNYSDEPYGDTLDSLSLAAIQQGYATSVETSTDTPTEPALHNLSVYAQDHWNLRPRLSIDYGLRWEFDPAPGPVNGEYPAVLTSTNIATATVAPLGTPPYKTRYDKFAPRVGFAWNAVPSQSHALTVRGGFGIFFDTGQATILSAYETGYPFQASNYQSGSFPLPLSSALMAPPAPPSSMGSLSPPYPQLNATTSTDLTLPYTEQWTISLDESLNSKNTFTLSYVGNNGKKLLLNEDFNGAPFGNQDFPSGLNFTNNASHSSYDALQLQDSGRIFNGLDIVGSFTYAHALDNLSTDESGYPSSQGNSDNDLRRVLNLALNYQTPTLDSNRWVEKVTHGWLLANRFSTQSGYPMNILQATGVLSNGEYTYYFPDLVPGAPIYLHGSAADIGGQSVPHNWRLNPAAFAAVPIDPTSGNPVRQGTLGRNYVRGPSFWALNTSIQRVFEIHEQLHLNFRVDAFNILNHPNLGSPDNSLSDSTFGQLLDGFTTTIGTPNQLYAMGAARSLQLSLKLQF